MKPPRNRIIRSAPITMVTVRVGRQPIQEGVHRAPGTSFDLPLARARALGPLVTILPSSQI